jgi:hypothetical protein
MSTKQKSSNGNSKQAKKVAPKIPPRPTPQSIAAYKNRVSAPTATTRVLATGDMVRAKGGDRPEVRREYLGDVNGSVAFTNSQYFFNPGLSSVFPWLSGIAPSFEEYVVDAVKFVYEPASASTATGTVVLSFEYDVLDPAPVDKVSALLVQDNVRTAPWTAASLALRSQDLKKRCGDALFIRTGAVPSSDQKTYDLGVLNVSTVGQSGATTVGELWVEYSIRLSVPQRSTPLGQLIVVSGASKAAPFTGTQTITGNSLVATATGSVLTFQVAGYYIINHVLNGATLTAIGLPVASTGSSSSTLYSAQIPTAATSGIATFQARMLAGGTLTFDDATGNTSVSATYTTISPWFTV